jgi:hypothetical protein
MFNYLQADEVAVTDGSADFEVTATIDSDPTANDTAVNSSEPNITAQNDTIVEEEKKEKNFSRKFITDIAVKYVKAMWIIQFTKITNVGLLQYWRSRAQKNAYNSAYGTTYDSTFTSSTAYKSYQASGILLLLWGIWGWGVFVTRQVALDNDLTKQLSLLTAQGNGVVGALIILISLWKTFGREKCSENSYWQCWYDSSPTDL